MADSLKQSPAPTPIVRELSILQIPVFGEIHETSFDDLEKQIDERHLELTREFSRLEKTRRIASLSRELRNIVRKICKGNELHTRVAVTKLTKFGRYCIKGLHNPDKLKCDLTAWRADVMAWPPGIEDIN